MKIFISNHLKAFCAIAFVLLAACAIQSCGDASQPKDDSILADQAREELNATIANANRYNHAKNSVIDSLRHSLRVVREESARRDIMVKLCTLYRQMNADSAISYGRQAVNGLNPTDTSRTAIHARLAYINALSTAGMFASATQDIPQIKTLCSDSLSKIEFWKSCRMLFSYMNAYVTGDQTYSQQLRQKYDECDDSLLNFLPASDTFRQFIYSERLIRQARWKEAEKSLLNILSNTERSDNVYGMAAYQLAQVYRHEGNVEKSNVYLARASQSDIMGCVKEGIALPELAYWSYQEGELDNAFTYINFALEEANAGNIRMRLVSIAPFMPLIDSAYRTKINDSRNLIFGYLICSVALLLIVAVLFIILMRTLRTMHRKERKLASTSKKLEANISNFIGLCSNYASRLDQLAKLVTRKLNANQTADLLKQVSSGRFTEEDNEEFYRLIDKAILDIFPDFVERINELLEPDKQIFLKPDEMLSPELRIYAFVRLGVDQSNRIAQILHYSVNTVYSYRNRMRNRAMDRDNFDATVMMMGQRDGEQGGLVPLIS